MSADSPSPDPSAAPREPEATGAPASVPGSVPLGFGTETASALQAAEDAGTAAGDTTPARPRKGPLSFLSGALTSGLLAWLCLGLSQKVVAYYAVHPPHYSAQIAQSIATALKTLIVGMCFLATFSFAFIGLGLALTFVRSLLAGREAEGAS